MARNKILADMASQDVTAAEFNILDGSDSGPLSHRNLIINGAMQIYQRGAVTGASNGSFALDRWRFSESGDPGVGNLTQDSDVPSGQGFANSLKFDVTTADSSLAAGDRNAISMKFEGLDLQRLAKGSSGAKTSTLSFWVKSPKTGVHIVWLYDGDNTRQISKSYSISSANTWENHSVTFAGDTTGAFDNDVNESATLLFIMSAGTDFTSGTLCTSWESYTAANSAVGQVNCMDSTSNNFYLTGVQWELGDNATPFEHRSYGDELARCQRYYQTGGSSGDGARVYLYTIDQDNTYRRGMIFFKRSMRSAPTLTVTGVGGYQWAGTEHSAVYTNGVASGNSDDVTTWVATAEL